MARVKLTLVPSKRMDSNKKDGRNENGLVRMSKITREHLGFTDTVEIFPDTPETGKRINNAILLDIHEAFSSDIKDARRAGSSKEELKTTGFVTTKMYNRITGNKNYRDVWITDDIVDTVIGADPEFLLFDGAGNVIRANNIIPKQGSIGSDGAMAEVRPNPAIAPEEIVSNIKELFADNNLVSSIRDLNWMAGCYHRDDQRTYPIGGHIHIGNPIKIARMDISDRLKFFKSFNKILDELLAVPMTKIDGAEQGKARRTEGYVCKYGYFGEFRSCNGHLEHRTLSGMWLMHPELSLLVFGTAKAIIDEVYNCVADNKYDMEYMFPKKFTDVNVWHPNFKSWKEIPLVSDSNCVTSSSEIIRILNESDPSRIDNKFLTDWHSRMKRLSTYKTYSKYIDGLYEVLKIEASAFQKFDKTIQRNWLEGAKFLS